MERNQLGVALFIASEVVFFGSLIIAYVTLSHRFDVEPGRTLDVGLTAVFSVFLISSSFTVIEAARQAERNRSRRAAAWLGLTVLLAIVFLAGQAFEWTALFGEGITASSGLFGTAFFTLTGFHGAHVTAGIVALLVLCGIAATGGMSRRRAASLEAVSLYWHFVDVVWIVIFAIVYIGGVLRG